MSNIKALIIQPKPNGDLGDILQIARAESAKIFYNPKKIKVLEILHSRYGEIAVVQNSDGCIAEKSNMNE